MLNLAEQEEITRSFYLTLREGCGIGQCMFRGGLLNFVVNFPNNHVNFITTFRESEDIPVELAQFIMGIAREETDEESIDY